MIDYDPDDAIRPLGIASADSGFSVPGWPFLAAMGPDAAMHWLSDHEIEYSAVSVFGDPLDIRSLVVHEDPFYAAFHLNVSTFSRISSVDSVSGRHAMLTAVDLMGCEFKLTVDRDFADLVMRYAEACGLRVKRTYRPTPPS